LTPSSSLANAAPEARRDMEAAQEKDPLAVIDVPELSYGRSTSGCGWRRTSPGSG